jgi:hypothetical protein
MVHCPACVFRATGRPVDKNSDHLPLDKGADMITPTHAGRAEGRYLRESRELKKPIYLS